MEINKKKACLRIVFDLLSLCMVGIPLLLLYLLASPFKRGYHCDDESLMYPHKANTIPTWLAGAVGLGLPTLTVLIIEGVRTKHSRQTCIWFMVACYQLLIPFYFGAAVSQLTTEITKLTVGRLRPHFLAVCVSNVASCTITTGYIDGDVCTGADSDEIESARKSFPSGHSSISFYCMTWLILYLQFKFTWKRYWLIRPVFQFIIFLMALYTALSRLSDFAHHWSDVIAGALLGTAVALLDIFVLSNLLPWKQKRRRESSNDLPMYGNRIKPTPRRQPPRE